MTVIDKLQAGTPALSEENLDYLITFMAVLLRAWKVDPSINDQQRKLVIDRCMKLIERYPGIRQRVFDAVDNKDDFWRVPADTLAKQLHEAGILVDTLGL